MRKIIGLICGLMLVNLTGCWKDVKVIRGPNNQLLVCTGELSRPGIAQAERSAVGGQCLVLNCQADFSLYNLQAFIDQYKSECESMENCWLNNWQNNEIPPEIQELVNQYPKLCVPAAQPCTTEIILDGERPWQGISFNSSLQDDNSQYLNEFDVENFLNQGYGGCQPKNEDSCAEGYAVREIIEGNYHYKICTPQLLFCLPEQPFAMSGQMIWNPLTNSYGECLITSCMAPAILMGNSCFFPDICQINPQMCP